MKISEIGITTDKNVLDGKREFVKNYVLINKILNANEKLDR